MSLQDPERWWKKCSGQVFNFTELRSHKSVFLSKSSDILLGQVHKRTAKSQASFVPEDILQVSGADGLA